MSILGSIFGQNKKGEKIKDLVAKGALIIDVRTPAEYSGGHIKGSQNIPLQTIAGKADKIKKSGKPVIVCCASGMRSAQAASILKSKGIECENGGGWTSLRSKLK